jgi:hypothetical protein
VRASWAASRCSRACISRSSGRASRSLSRPARSLATMMSSNAGGADRETVAPEDGGPLGQLLVRHESAVRGLQAGEHVEGPSSMSTCRSCRVRFRRSARAGPGLRRRSSLRPAGGRSVPAGHRRRYCGLDRRRRRIWSATFSLDDRDLPLVGKRRGDHNRMGVRFAARHAAPLGHVSGRSDGGGGPAGVGGWTA